MKDSGRAINVTVKVPSSGLAEALTTVSLRMTAEMVKARCFTQTALSMMERGETTPVTAKEYLNGLKALDDSREISETTRCMETALWSGRVERPILANGD